MSKLIECVPNFSAGREPDAIRAISEAIASVEGVLLLDETADADHNRSVFTFAAGPEAVEEAVLRAARIAVERIDLRRHRGAHPRIGAMDVVPLVPLEGGSAQQCARLARRIGARLWSELRIPVYFYGDAAVSDERRPLENLRRGGFEALCEEAARDPARAPDVGGPEPHPSAGATAVGVRKFLIAFNVNLRTSDLGVARRIARSIRESSGGLEAVKALGLALPSRGSTQVSMNLTDFERTSIGAVYQRIRQEAAAAGGEIAGLELIGLIPRKAFEQAAAEGVPVDKFAAGAILEERIAERRKQA